MTTGKELCLPIAKCFINFGNKRLRLLVPSPPIKVTVFLRAFFSTMLTFPRTETERAPASPKIMKLTRNFKEIRKVFPYQK